MLRKTERQEEKGVSEDEMAGWHHRLEQAPGVGKSGVLRSTELQIFSHDRATELN